MRQKNNETEKCPTIRNTHYTLETQHYRIQWIKKHDCELYNIYKLYSYLTLTALSLILVHLFWARRNQSAIKKDGDRDRDRELELEWEKVRIRIECSYVRHTSEICIAFRCSCSFPFSFWTQICTQRTDMYTHTHIYIYINIHNLCTAVDVRESILFNVGPFIFAIMPVITCIYVCTTPSHQNIRESFNYKWKKKLGCASKA